MTEGERFSIYVYDPDNGDCVRIIPGIDKVLARPMAMDLHSMEGVAIKIVDEFDGCVVYTLGV